MDQGRWFEQGKLADVRSRVNSTHLILWWNTGASTSGHSSSLSRSLMSSYGLHQDFLGTKHKGPEGHHHHWGQFKVSRIWIMSWLLDVSWSFHFFPRKMFACLTYSVVSLRDQSMYLYIPFLFVFYNSVDFSLIIPKCVAVHVNAIFQPQKVRGNIAHRMWWDEGTESVKTKVRWHRNSARSSQ